MRELITHTVGTGGSATTTTKTLYYLYDASGSVAGLIYNGNVYYFQKNIQGDIIRICNAGGDTVVEYTYDAWGKVLSVTGTMASTLGQDNPFRYRGYYYDTETGFYYLQTRYYDPEVGRFLNADVIIGANGDIPGYNMFAYCSNNPIGRSDPFGQTGKKGFCMECFGGNHHYPYNDFELMVFDAAKEFKVDPTMIAAVISAEQRHNVNILDLADVPCAWLGIDTSIGKGQVKVSTAELVENMGYIAPSSSRCERIKRLANLQENIRYTAAYLAYMRDIWIDEYPCIETDVAIWGTLYNGGKTDAHPNPISSDFGLWCVEEYEVYKSLFGYKR